ncbi:hypothetical protein [uncultured Methanolobus sp.]|nr:hypothetical protein [uncultured Methanolobus sp.]
MLITLQEFNGQYRLTMPKNIMEIEGYKKGQKFEVIKVQGYLALKPVV